MRLLWTGSSSQPPRGLGVAVVLVLVLAACVAVAAVAQQQQQQQQQVFGGAGADPLANEHAGIAAQIMYEQMHPDEPPAWQRDAMRLQHALQQQEMVTNANSGNIDDGGAAMTELSAAASDKHALREAQKQRAEATLALRQKLHMMGGVATYTAAGHRSRNRHRNRHRQHQNAKWPEFEGGQHEGGAQEALEAAMENANAGGLTTDDVPPFPESFIGWFKYGKPLSHNKIRGRLTYDYKLRKLQIDYFPGGLARETYFFDYQKQVRQMYHFIGSVDPTRRSYKKALEKKKKREKEEEAAAEKGEELPPVARGSDALHQEDMLVLDNEDYTWKECTSWDLVEPYHVMCPTECYTLVNDPSVASIPENAVSDDGGTLDPYQDEKTVIIFLRGFIPGMKEGEDDPESGTLAVDHPPLWVRYVAMRNNTPTEIQLGDYVWTFFRWVDLSDWDNFDLKDSGIIEALAKPDRECIYAGAFTKEVEEFIQPKVPVVLSKRGDAEEEEEG